MKAKTLKAKTPDEVRSQLDQCMSDDYKPTLALVFLSIKQDKKAICNILGKKQIAVFGATTAGEFIDEEISQGEIAIMLLDMNPDYFKLMFFEKKESSVKQLAALLGSEGKKSFTEPAFIIGVGYLSNSGEQIVDGIQEGTGSHPTIYGAMAGDDLLLSGPIVFTTQQSSVSGLVALIIDESKIDISGIATCGWKAVGTAKTITKSHENIIHTIDDQPALDMVMKFLGAEVQPVVGDEVVTHTGSYYPLQMERENMPPVMRTAMFANQKDRSLICAGNVPQGSKVRFSLPPDFDVIDRVVQDCKTLRDQNQESVDAIIMFSCISRYLALDMLISKEIERVSKVWDAPLTGFFSYGEFGKSKNGIYEYHNNTCCIVTLKEK